MSTDPDGDLTRLRTLLRGHTDRHDERAILDLLATASPSALDALVRTVDLATLFGAVDDRFHGPQHRTELDQLLTEKRLADLGVGARVALLRALQRGRTSAADEAAIGAILCGTRGPPLARLKAAFDAGDDYRDLHQLVFSDVDDDALRRRIVAHLAAEAPSLPAARTLLSDIDDTFYANWKDDRFPGKTVYPGVHAFYEALSPDVVFVTARPGDRAGLVEDHTLSALRERGLARPRALCGTFSSALGNDRIARQKYKSFCEYRSVYPERRFVFVGDSGQGDVAFGRMLLDDPSGSVDAVFIHDVVATPAVERARLAGCNVHLFETYVGAALVAHGLGLADAVALARVVEAAHEALAAVRFDSEAQKHDRLAELARDIGRAREAIGAAASPRCRDQLS